MNFLIASVGPPAVSQTSTENLKAHSGGSFANSATIEPFRALNWSAAIFAATAHCLDRVSPFENGSQRLARNATQSQHCQSQAVVGRAHEIAATRTPTRARRVIFMANQGNFLEWSFRRRRVLIEARASLTSTSYVFVIIVTRGWSVWPEVALARKKKRSELAAFNILGMTAVATRRVAIEPWASQAHVLRARQQP